MWESLCVFHALYLCVSVCGKVCFRVIYLFVSVPLLICVSVCEYESSRVCVCLCMLWLVCDCVHIARVLRVRVCMCLYVSMYVCMCVWACIVFECMRVCGCAHTHLDLI
jgi:hypothetical protein